jgi:hypothetical protein
MTTYSPGDTVRVIGWPNETFAGGTILGANFGGNGGIGTVQGQSFHPQPTNQWVHVKFHVQGPIFQIPSAFVTPAPGATTVFPLPGVQAGWSAPGHHLK